MQRVKYSLFSFFSIASLFIASNLSAQTDTNSTVALSEKLNKLQMFDLSFYLLDKALSKNPVHKDKLKIQKAQTYFAMKDEDKGMKILNSISSSSTSYPYSRLVLGIHLVNKRQFKEAAVPLEAYCSSVKRNPPSPNDKFRIAEFQKAVAYLQYAYKQLGDTEKAVRATEYLKIVAPKKGGKKSKLDEFGDIVFATQVKLDIAQQLKEQKKESWKKDTESVLKPLATILEDDGDPTVFTVMAAIEKIKAYVMLGELKKAEELIKEYKDMARSLDDAFKKDGAFQEAPSAKMYLWIAHYNYELAKKQTDNAKAKKLAVMALKDFYRVITEYDIKRCPYVPEAAKCFNMVKQDLINKYGVKKISTSVEIPANFELDRIEELYGKKQYAKVIPAIQKILRSPDGKNSENTPALLSKLTDCYIKTNKLLEATTLAGFMGDCFPDAPNTPLFLLQLGELKWKEAKAKGDDTPAGKKAKEDALMIYGWYIKDCPTHKYAADICAKIAMEAYKKAAAMAEKVNKMPNGEAKLEANMQAREEFKKVIPKLEYIVNNYSQTKRGKEAAFIMGNCYSNALEYLKGSDVFAKYCDLETNYPKKNERKMDRVADAKFRMADNYVKYAESIKDEVDKLKKTLEEAPEQVPEGSKELSKADIQKEIDAKNAEAKKYFLLAIKNFKELTGEWMQKGGRLYEVRNQKKIKNLYDKTLAYIPWVYDYAGDIDKTIAAFTEFLNKFPNNKAVPTALKRRAFKYIEKGDTQMAAKDFATLSSKYPDQAKEIQPELARAMYDTRNYPKSIEAVKKMFEGNTADISVGNLRWVANNLWDCRGLHPKEGAELALKATGLLLKRLKKPVLKDWVRKEKIPALKADKKKLSSTLKIIRDQLLLMGVNAAYWAEDYKTAVKFLNDILSNPDTPYFYDAHYKRAEVYVKLKEYQKALKDYGEVSNALLGDSKATDSKRFMTQVLVGITYIKMGDLGKAIGAMAGPVMTVMSIGNDLAKLKAKVSKDEKARQMKYVEYAVYLSAACQKKLGDKKKLKDMVNIYWKSFPNGKFKNKITVLPSPEQAADEVLKDMNKK